MNNYFFTSDEHLGHANVIRFNNRPFSSVEEMDEELIRRFNEKVSNTFNNITIHCGDFSFNRDYNNTMKKYIERLNGQHVFLRGSHDYWMRKVSRKFNEIWEKNINGVYVVSCHYSLRTWPRSHYGSWHVFGHSHGNLQPFGKSMDVGVDTNNYQPYSFEELKAIMDTLEDNFNLIRKR